MVFSKWIPYKCSAKAVASTRSYEMKRFHWFKGGALELTDCRSQFFVIKVWRGLLGCGVADDVNEDGVAQRGVEFHVVDKGLHSEEHGEG